MSITAYQFWSPTCAPCKAIKPVVEDLKEEFSSITWLSINTHDDKDGMCSKYSVAVVPTIVVVSIKDDGEIVSIEKQSGTNIAGYYRIIRGGLKAIQQS
jgi:thiol-disulfide isomerase/thioredoxin